MAESREIIIRAPFGDPEPGDERKQWIHGVKVDPDAVDRRVQFARHAQRIIDGQTDSGVIDNAIQVPMP